MSVTLLKSLGLRYRQVLTYVPENGRANVEILRAMATGYVWGVQDTLGPEERDTSLATDFGYAFGTHAGLYAAGRIGIRHNIETAYRSWRELGWICPDYNG